MDNLIRSIYKYDLSGNDVEYITRGKSKVLLYDTLTPNDNIIQRIGPTNQTILLFPTEAGNEYSGHWISLIYRPSLKQIEHWDSYGLSPDAEAQYSTSRHVQAQILQQLYNKARQQGYKILYNPYRFQKMSNGVNVCGRMASIRNRFHYLDIEAYKKLMFGQSMSPDFIVSIMTFLSLNEELTTEQNLLSQLN